MSHEDIQGRVVQAEGMTDEKARDRRGSDRSGDKTIVARNQRVTEEEGGGGEDKS